MTEIKGPIYPDLEGKGVLITGGGSGIGESIVHHFARQNVKIGFLDMSKPRKRLLLIAPPKA